MNNDAYDWDNGESLSCIIYLNTDKKLVFGFKLTFQKSSVSRLNSL